MEIFIFFMIGIFAPLGAEFEAECNARMAADPTLETCVEEGVNDLADLAFDPGVGAISTFSH